MNIREGSTFKIGENIFFTELDDEVCLFCNSKGEYLNFNDTASHIWKLIEKEFQFKNIIKELMSEYEISKEICTIHAKDFISDLIKKEIITLI